MPLFRVELQPSMRERVGRTIVYVAAEDAGDAVEVLRDHGLTPEVALIEKLEPFYEPVEVAGPLATAEAHTAARERHRDILARGRRRCARQGCGNVAVDGGVGCEMHEAELADGFEAADELAAMGQLASAMGATVAAPIALRNAMRLRTMSAAEYMVPERADVGVYEFYAAPAEIDRALGSGIVTLDRKSRHAHAMSKGDYLVLWGRTSALIGVYVASAGAGAGGEPYDDVTIRLQVATYGKPRACAVKDCPNYARWIGASPPIGEKQSRVQGYLCADHLDEGEPLRVTQVIDRPWPEVLPGRGSISTDIETIEPLPEWRDA